MVIVVVVVLAVVVLLVVVVVVDGNRKYTQKHIHNRHLAPGEALVSNANYYTNARPSRPPQPPNGS